MHQVLLSMIPVILILLVLSYVEASSLTANRKAVRNANLDGIYKTESQLWENHQHSRMRCMASCLRHIDCRSFAYDSNTKRCQAFNRDFRGQKKPNGEIDNGTLHYDLVNDDCGKHGPFANAPEKDCAGVHLQGYNCSGVYTIVLDGYEQQVWCDFNTDGGRWTVIQRRQDGSVNFNVGWMSYAVSFGTPSREYWIGNDALHALTSNGRVELLILMERWNGEWFHAKYASFKVNGHNDNYRLTVSGYSGTAGDSLWRQNGQPFSTNDQNNDAYSFEYCNPSTFGGGWWFKGCSDSNLNGRYYDAPTVLYDACHWYDLSQSSESLKTVFMMVRKN